MTTQHLLWTLAGAAAAVALAAALLDRRRLGRRDLDQVGWVPWPAIQIVAMIAAVVAAVLAVKA